MTGTRRWHAELAWLGAGEVQAGVLIEAAGPLLRTVTPGIAASALPPGTQRLPGLTLPGLANAHSHAFHRALRGVTEQGQGTFWTWRERMYQVAGRLTPDSYLALARAAYAEMALAGVTCVGEFHYLHHGPDGVRYADPNEMGRALMLAAEQAGLRITLLDACYLSGGLAADGRAEPLSPVQRRFCDGDAERWAERVAGLGWRRARCAGAARPGRRGHPLGARRAAGPDAPGGGLVTRFWRAAARAPVRAARGERGQRGRLRHDAGPGAGRRRARSGRAAPWCTPPI